MDSTLALLAPLRARYCGRRSTDIRQQRLPITIAVVATCITAPSPSLEAQERPPVFSSGVALVPITAIVRDSRNRLVHLLAKDDFQVLENDQPRPIVDFRSTDHAPISVALLVDTSGSMRGTNLDQAKAVADRLLHSLDASTDEVALFTFDKAIRREAPFSKNPATIGRALDRVDAWGLTSLYDAIGETAKQLADRPSQRRALIVITDGVDTSSTLSPAEASGLASAIDVPVYVLSVLPHVPQQKRDSVATDGGLSNLASWTGGDLHDVTSPGQTEAAVEVLMAELRQQYFIAIESAAATGWYRLDVRTKRKGLTVRARSGYFATRLRGEFGNR